MCKYGLPANARPIFVIRCLIACLYVEIRKHCKIVIIYKYIQILYMCIFVYKYFHHIGHHKHINTTIIITSTFFVWYLSVCILANNQYISVKPVRSKVALYISSQRLEQSTTVLANMFLEEERTDYHIIFSFITVIKCNSIM